jgi:hypothetical protein
MQLIGGGCVAGSGSTCSFGTGSSSCEPVGCYSYALQNSLKTFDKIAPLIFKNVTGYQIDAPLNGTIQNGHSITVGKRFETVEHLAIHVPTYDLWGYHSDLRDLCDPGQNALRVIEWTTGVHLRWSTRANPRPEIPFVALTVCFRLWCAKNSPAAHSR